MLDLTVRENRMTTRARTILRREGGRHMKQIDVWHELPTDYQSALVAKYGTESKARTAFFNAIAAMNSTDPNIELVTIGMNGTSTYKWVRSPKKAKANGAAPIDDDMSFTYIGQTNDGTPLYRNVDGVIGMVEWQPL